MTLFIKTRKEFFNALRSKGETYCLYFGTLNGSAISFQAAKDNCKELGRALSVKNDNEYHERIVFALDVNYESKDLWCDINEEPIESMY